METVTYTGPDEQVCHALAAATGGPLELVHGASYSVNADLADSLVSSSVHWQHAGVEKSKAELVAEATELGVENPGRLIKQALVAAIAAKKAETVGPDADGITEPDGEEVSADA
jgi:hypothetical protein